MLVLKCFGIGSLCQNTCSTTSAHSRQILQAGHFKETYTHRAIQSINPRPTLGAGYEKYLKTQNRTNYRPRHCRQNLGPVNLKTSTGTERYKPSPMTLPTNYLERVYSWFVSVQLNLSWHIRVLIRIHTC